MPKRAAPPLADGDSFSAFYEANARDLLVFFVRRVLEVDAALDLTAETFALAFLHRDRIRGSTSAQARSWLYGIARHQLGRFHRRGRRTPAAMARRPREKRAERALRTPRSPFGADRPLKARTVATFSPGSWPSSSSGPRTATAGTTSGPRLPEAGRPRALRTMRDLGGSTCPAAPRRAR